MTELTFEQRCGAVFGGAVEVAHERTGLGRYESTGLVCVIPVASLVLTVGVFLWLRMFVRKRRSRV